MPHSLQITDGVTTVSLTTTNVMLSHYVPQEARKKPGMVADYEDVTEPIEAMIYGSATTIVQQIHRRIEGLLFAATHRTERGVGRRVYIQYRPSGDPFLWRAELRGGSVNLGANAMTAWGQAKIQATLVITRSGVWERTDEVEVPIYSRFHTELGVGGRLINNHNGNYAVIPPAAIQGVVPTPARIVLTNADPQTRIYRNIYLANDVQNSIHHFVGIVEAEDKVITSSGTIQGNMAGNSMNSVLRLNFSAIAFPRWAYPAVRIQAASGKMYRLFARFSWYTQAPGTVVYVEPQLTAPNGAANLNPYRGEQALPSFPLQQRELVDSGTLAIPEWGAGPPAGPMHVMLAFRTSAPVMVELDYIFPLPADNFRHLAYMGMGVRGGGSIVDDGVDGYAYEDNANGQQSRTVAGAGSPILLWPNTGFNQCIYVLQDQGARSIITDRFYIRVFYRPRRLTI